MKNDHFLHKKTDEKTIISCIKIATEKNDYFLQKNNDEKPSFLA